MCSLFWQMENDHGDLSDILRANSGGGGGAAGSYGATSSGYDWNFPPEPMNFTVCPDDRIDDLSTIFHSVRDPSLHETEMVNSMFYPGSNPLFLKKDDASFSDHVYKDTMMGQEMKPLLSRMIQIGPKPKVPVPAGNSASPSSVSPGVVNPLSDVVKGSSLGRSDENGGVQMNCPRNPTSKKRKNQIKKVVCIPAPAAPSSNRPTGEVVPSDLWAWRKYGQKPIKGSPYPRGYYRCSSSKGCSARKQVERSRNDPNMLVITYTSEHNHPWPTQRNALAGSTRSQLTKAASASKVSPPPPDTPTTEEAMNEELIKDNTNTHKGNEELIKDENGKESRSVCVKEEAGDVNKSLEMDAEDMNQDFHYGYRPFLPESQSDDFFAELDELEPNPLKLIFPHGLNYEKSNEDSENKGLDPFGLYDDWTGNSSRGPRKGL